MLRDRLLIAARLDPAGHSFYISTMVDRTTDSATTRQRMLGWGIAASLGIHAVIAFIALYDLPAVLPQQPAEEALNVEIVMPIAGQENPRGETHAQPDPTTPEAAEPDTVEPPSAAPPQLSSAEKPQLLPAGNKPAGPSASEKSPNEIDLAEKAPAGLPGAAAVKSPATAEDQAADAGAAEPLPQGAAPTAPQPELAQVDRAQSTPSQSRQHSSQEAQPVEPRPEKTEAEAAQDAEAAPMPQAEQREPSQRAAGTPLDRLRPVFQFGDTDANLDTGGGPDSQADADAASTFAAEDEAATVAGIADEPNAEPPTDLTNPASQRPTDGAAADAAGTTGRGTDGTEADGPRTADPVTDSVAKDESTTGEVATTGEAAAMDGAGTREVGTNDASDEARPKADGGAGDEPRPDVSEQDGLAAAAVQPDRERAEGKDDGQGAGEGAGNEDEPGADKGLSAYDGAVAGDGQDGGMGRNAVVGQGVDAADAETGASTPAVPQILSVPQSGAGADGRPSVPAASQAPGQSPYQAAEGARPDSVSDGSNGAGKDATSKSGGGANANAVGGAGPDAVAGVRDAPAGVKRDDAAGSGRDDAAGGTSGRTSGGADENAGSSASGGPEAMSDRPGGRANEQGAPGDAAAMAPAKRLFSRRVANQPMAVMAMNVMTREQRAAELCSTELREQLRHGTPVYNPDILPRPQLTGENSIEVQAVGFRARQRWHEVSFRCVVDKDARKVISFAHRVGGAIPKSEWRKRGFPAY
ncbi:DUF930 domain-containing protein [Neorhizobium sp. NPDC001467]|uniref:DUF930 domain-containing protein n=1 Tax=Neorhizobium sp. NPDC001467 TaxID=3390595 RepID=UPI003D030EB0